MAVSTTPIWALNNGDQFAIGVYTTEQAALARADQIMSDPNYIDSPPMLVVPGVRVIWEEDPE